MHCNQNQRSEICEMRIWIVVKKESTQKQTEKCDVIMCLKYLEEMYQVQGRKSDQKHTNGHGWYDGEDGGGGSRCGSTVRCFQISSTVLITKILLTSILMQVQWKEILADFTVSQISAEQKKIINKWNLYSQKL